MAGCEFNRELEIDKYVENKEIHGERFARQYLKTNMAHYRAKEAGQTIPSWDVYLTEKGLITADGEGLLELTEQPLTSHFSRQISGDIKMRVPIEMETVRHANALAASGADTIFMPEHISENGGIFVRFVTRYQRDLTDPNKYLGSQIDLGENMVPEEARIKMQDMVGDSHFARSLQSNTYKDAYAFGTEKVKRGDSDLLSNRVRHISIREPILQQPPILIAEKPVRQNRLYSTDPLGHVFNEAAKIGKAVAVETATTAIMTGKYLFERIHKKKEKKPEVSISTMNRRNGKQEIKPSEKIDRFNLILYKRHTEMREAKNALVIIRKTAVGAGAIPFLISVLARELPAPIKEVKKSLRRHAKKDLRMKNKELRKIVKRETKKYSVKVQPLKTERAEPLRSAKERKVRVKRGLEKGIKKVGEAEILTPIVSEKRERRRKKRLRRVMRNAERILENMRIPKRERKFWVILAVAAAELASQGLALRSWEDKKRKGITYKHREVLTSRPGLEAGSWNVQQEHTAIAGVQFAWMVWTMLNCANFPPVESKITSIRFGKSSSRREEGMTVHDHEVSTPWVLLSIIQYLTALREQGRGSNPTNPTNKPIRPIKNGHMLPQHGIIFAYAS